MLGVDREWVEIELDPGSSYIGKRKPVAREVALPDGPTSDLVAPRWAAGGVR